MREATTCCICENSHQERRRLLTSSAWQGLVPWLDRPLPLLGVRVDGFVPRLLPSRRPTAPSPAVAVAAAAALPSTLSMDFSRLKIDVPASSTWAMASATDAAWRLACSTVANACVSGGLRMNRWHPFAYA